MSQLAKLRSATTLAKVAELLGLKSGMLSYILYVKPKADLYSKFSIAKKSGGQREISAPAKDLKLVQHRLAELLQACSDEIALSHGQVGLGISHGFKPKHSTMTNARRHITRRYVFNADIHDFFGTLNFGRVRGFFLKDKNFLLNDKVATILAQIACTDNSLPQGSPCSPIISNLVAHILDIHLAKLAASTGCTYTRYADDLTFSSNKSPFPMKVAVQAEEMHKWIPGSSLERLVKQAGFEFNPKKTRMQYRDSRQEVTGLTVNRKVNVPTPYRRTVRAIVHTALRTGKFSLPSDVDEEPSGGQERNAKVIGMLAYIDQVDRFNDSESRKNDLEPADTSARIEIFRQFLYYSLFYDLSRPLLVCEGPTDNIYMRHAIRRLAPAYPSLVQSVNSSIQIKLRMFKYSERRGDYATQGRSWRNMSPYQKLSRGSDHENSCPHA
ncbi:retron Ec67 family RNA-directed DNA polymerase/endonuclease [Variovorax sp. VNK109]|uniref:retron Ec67 family RNA-directed DNA polymerase/endonuclease n=1 Tax=Variovorax sp. VNK109 TaxID=3400919 RepID=UPI003C10E721